MIAGWGRHFTDWNDITACHRHVWEQAECVRRLRERLGQFPVPRSISTRRFCTSWKAWSTPS